MVLRACYALSGTDVREPGGWRDFDYLVTSCETPNWVDVVFGGGEDDTVRLISARKPGRWIADPSAAGLSKEGCASITRQCSHATSRGLVTAPHTFTPAPVHYYFSSCLSRTHATPAPPAPWHLASSRLASLDTRQAKGTAQFIFFLSFPFSSTHGKAAGRFEPDSEVPLLQQHDLNLAHRVLRVLRVRCLLVAIAEHERLCDGAQSNARCSTRQLEPARRGRGDIGGGGARG
eukprot:1236260-Rhodomonas_salina.1